jgi:hypothetical protein
VRGCQVRKERRAVFCQDRDRLDQVALDLRHRDLGAWALVINPARDQILHRRAAAAIGNVRDIDPDRRIEQRAGEMYRGACSARSVLHLPLVRF